MAELAVPVALAGSAPEARCLQRSSPWVRGPAWDAFWMQSALWLAPIVLWLAHGYSDPEASPLDSFYLALTALFWIGHRLCSTYLAYCTEAYRPLLRAEPIRFVAIPLLVTATCFAVLLPADTALPWSREERIVVLAIIDYAWVTYHFASQHFGALSLYRFRAGRVGDVRTRRWDRLFALGVGGVLVFVADLLAGAVAYQDQWMNRWPFLDSIVSVQDEIRLAGMVILVLITLGMLFVELRTRQFSMPRLLYIIGMAVMVGIALRPRSLFLFLVVWTSQHWILATGMASRVARGEPAPATGVLRRSLHALNVRPWAILIFLTVISVVLLPFFEVEANHESGTYYGDRIFGAIATGLRSSAWVPALVALGFATGFIHYLLDRSIYRMSDPKVRTAARGLLSQR